MFRTNANLVYAAMLVVLSAWCFPAIASCDDAPDARAVVERLFEVGWDASFSARAALDREYKGLSPVVQTEPRIQYAHALTLIKQGRQREAKEGVDALVKTYEGSITPLKTKIWLAVLTEQHGPAMADMEKISVLLSKQVKPGAERDEYVSAARTLGLLFGYLEGPCAGTVASTARAGHQKRIQQQLDGPLEDAFRDGHRDAILAYLDLKRQYDVKEEETKKESERVRVAEKKRIESERVRLAEQRAQVKEDVARRRDELQSELDAIAAAESPLVQEQVAADRTRMAAFRELNDVLDDLDFLEHELAHERDPVIRARLLREIRRLERIGDAYRIDVLEAERQIALVQSDIAGLRRRGAQMQSNMSDQLNRAEREVRNIDKREKVLDANEKKLDKPILDSRPLLPLQRKMDALATYAPFPLEEEKRRLLTSL